MKIKIMRRKVAKQLLNSMAGGSWQGMPSLAPRRGIGALLLCSCSTEIKSKSTIKSKNVELNLPVFGVVQPRFSEIRCLSSSVRLDY
jgi:hypothetical protein